MRKITKWMFSVLAFSASLVNAEEVSNSSQPASGRPELLNIFVYQKAELDTLLARCTELDSSFEKRVEQKKFEWERQQLMTFVMMQIFVRRSGASAETGDAPTVGSVTEAVNTAMQRPLKLPDDVTSELRQAANMAGSEKIRSAMKTRNPEQQIQYCETAAKQFFEDRAKMGRQLYALSAPNEAVPPPTPLKMQDIRSIGARIKGNIHYDVPAGMEGNEPVEYLVELSPNGSVSEIKLVKTSGISAFDSAVRLAIEKTAPYSIPKNDAGNSPVKFTLVSRPKN